MNDNSNQQILAEIRQVRRELRTAAIIVVVALFTILVFCVWFSRPYPVAHPNLWGAVHEAMNRMEYERAAGLVQQIVTKYPSDYNGYAYLGNIALITGHVQQVEGYYTQADQLFPSEQNDKMFATIRARLAKDGSPLPAIP